MTERHKKTKSKFKYYPELAFIEHIRELRLRLMYIIGSILIGSTIAYFVQQQLVRMLLKPSHGQRFIYTSPIGGISFLFSVCMYFGIALAIPVVVYQVLGFLEPVIKLPTKKQALKISLVTGLLAALGIIFGYVIGLPVALRFLSHQFTNKQIQPLFTIQEYLSFVMFYLLGSALLFQIPVVIYFINRFKPLKPKGLFKYERYVIVVAFIVSMLMAPTINVFSQLIIAGPIIVIYQLSILMVWLVNRPFRRKNHTRVVELIEMDRQAQLERAARTPIAVFDSLAAASVQQPAKEENVSAKPTIGGSLAHQFRQDGRRLIDDFRVYRAKSSNSPT